MSRPRRMTPMPPCRTRNCGKPSKSLGWCHTCYCRRQRERGALGRPLSYRLFPHLMINPETGCVLWTGCKNPGGYGVISVDGMSRMVHRVVYEMFAEPIPESLTLDHLCRVRNCVNVAHLEPVTNAENVRRGWIARKVAS